MSQLTEITDEIDLKGFLRIFARQYILILSIIFLGFSLSLYSYLSSEKYYKITSLFQVFPVSPGSGAGISLGSEFGTSSSQPDIELIENLYKSRTNAINIIKHVGLNTEIKDRKDINIAKLEIKNFNNQRFLNLYLKLNESSYHLLDNDKNIILEHEYNELYESENLSIKIMKPIIEDEGYIELIHYDPSFLYKSLVNNLNLNFIESKKFYSSGGLMSFLHIR